MVQLAEARGRLCLLLENDNMWSILTAEEKDNLRKECGITEMLEPLRYIVRKEHQSTDPETVRVMV